MKISGPCSGREADAVSVFILTHNEGLHIARAIASARLISTEIFVIDSGSTDRTIEIARENGAVVLTNEWVSHAHQVQWALENAPLTGKWVMRLDADEVIEAALAAEINNRLPTLPADVAGINLNRKHIFLGRWIRHGGRYPVVLLRIWRRGCARVEQRWMDEHMLLTSGRAVTFRNSFADHNLQDLTFFTNKHNRYATLEAVEIINGRRALFAQDEALGPGNSSRSVSLKRFIKIRMYNRLPFWLSSTAYFCFRYFIQLGFLDGAPGVIYHFLQGYWYRFLVGAKVVEYEREIGELEGDEALSRLSEITGLRLVASGPSQKSGLEPERSTANSGDA